MVCFTPLKAYRGSGGQVVFSSKEGFGDRPLDLPCGSCTGCLVKRSREWAFRCMHEAQVHAKTCLCGCQRVGGVPRNSFLTLTYTNDITWRDGVRYGLPADGSLDIRHWQLFAKRLRKARGPFRFLMVGEYGGKTYRPHYHAIVFGQDFSDDRVRIANPKGKDPLYNSASLDSLWGHGYCSIGSVSFASAGYVARYCLNKRGHKVQTERYRRIDVATGEEYYVAHEFTSMSRRPGIGASWFARFRDDVFPSDELVVDGRKYGVPRFYDTLEGEVSMVDVKAARVRKALKFREDATAERLRVREQIAEADRERFLREF